MTILRTIASTATGLLLAVALAACSTPGNDMGMHDNDGTNSSPSAGPDANSHNQADITFTMMMVPHHQQAIEMADVILGKDGIDEKVKALAKQIKAAQAPEIKLMTGWLTDWNYPSGMSGMSGDGMMSDDDMAALSAASGVDASRLFLQQMVEHHTGAIEMAQTELAAGKDARVIALATSIIASQTAEIATMKSMLAAL